MSRFNIKWKPQGVIPRDIGLTVKMQKLPEKRQECPASGECASPPLVAAWIEMIADVPELTAEQAVSTDTFPSRTSIPPPNIYGDIAFALSAAIVNADWQTSGATTPAWIDLHALTWDIVYTDVQGLPGGAWSYATVLNDWTGALVILNGINVAGLPSGTDLGMLTVTPTYQGVALNTLTALFKASGW